MAKAKAIPSESCDPDNKARFSMYFVRAVGCWVWVGRRNKSGYGEFYLHPYGRRLAHRVAYAMFNGDVPENVFVLHRCDNPYCVNPAHLWLGDQQDNIRDAAIKGRLKPPPIRQKLSEDQVQEIIQSRGSAAKIARGFGVSREQIRKIRNGTSRSAMARRVVEVIRNRPREAGHPT